MTNKEFLKRLGIEIKVARIRQGISQEKVAQFANIDEQVVSKIERGATDSHILTYKRVTDALGISLKDVL
jgi:transcriptional regulator with XRE-family HTH domain